MSLTAEAAGIEFVVQILELFDKPFNILSKNVKSVTKKQNMSSKCSKKYQTHVKEMTKMSIEYQKRQRNYKNVKNVKKCRRHITHVQEI